jgi:hypothetical protein
MFQIHVLSEKTLLRLFIQDADNAQGTNDYEKKTDDQSGFFKKAG